MGSEEPEERMNRNIRERNRKMDDEKFELEYGKIVAKAWSDEGFKKRLFADPASVLKESGMKIPEGVQVKLMENTDTLVHIPFPCAPSDELGLEQLDKAAGGGSVSISWMKAFS